MKANHILKKWLCAAVTFCLIMCVCSCESSYKSGNAEIDKILNNLVTGERTEAALANIRELDLSGLNIDKLPPLLDHCTGLVALNLSHNAFAAVNLTKYEKLVRIDLSYNKLEHLSEDFMAADNLKNVKAINLTGNRISAIPPVLVKMTGLNELYLGHNKLTAVGRELNVLKQLRIANFGNNEIKRFDMTCRSLQILNIENNQLRDMPEQIFTNKLLVLYAGHNSFRKLPDSVINCKSLTSLRLEGNDIWYFPPELQQMAALKILNLSGCNISYVPANICVLPNLETLYLNDNKIATIPSAMAGLVSLKSLYLDNNAYTSFNYNMKYIVPSLRILSLKGNRIPQLPDYIYKDTNLYRIDISDNPLDSSEIQSPKITFGQSFLPEFDGTDDVVRR